MRIGTQYFSLNCLTVSSGVCAACEAPGAVQRQAGAGGAGLQLLSA